MPSIYTHYYFADKCVDVLPRELQAIVRANRKFYDLGCGGADVLFFYKPYKKTDVRRYGSLLHREKMKDQMDRFRAHVVGSCYPDRDIAYLAGYYTHFILDSAMHPFIWKMDRQKVEKHFIIEADYDRKLLIKSGENAFSNKFLRFKKSDSQVWETLSKYLNTTPRNIRVTLNGRKRFVWWISSHKPLIRPLVEFAFKLTGNAAGLDVLIQKEENANCPEIRNTLDLIMKSALTEAERYGGEFWNFISGKGELGERFDRDFE